MPNQSMSLTQDQRLQMVLAPQLRQSLEMLQLPMMELRAMVRAELEKNPTLEELPTPSTPVEVEAGTSEPEERQPLDFQKEFETLARLDDEWRDYFFQQDGAYSYSQEAAERRQYFFDSISEAESLQAHLLRQLALASLSEDDRRLGELIIGSINDDGYLSTSVDELAATTGADPARLRSLVALVQDFDPTGVGAADLRECLLLQLSRLGKDASLPASIVRDHLQALAARKLQDIAKALRVAPEEVQKAGEFIATLDPKPGRVYSSEVSPYVLPEVVVRRVNGDYVVLLNDDDLPRIRISRQYRDLMGDSSTGDDVRTYIQERVRAGAFLIKSIQQRQQTIFNIATQIVKVQRDFLEHGVSRLKPLTMSQVADAVGLHETTVSRAVAGKHMQTPVGTYEMKFFFTPGLRTTDGGTVSNKTVRDRIGALVAAEDPRAPLSDQDIMDRLQAEGIKVARRTITKYRKILKIAPSHLRRVY